MDRAINLSFRRSRQVILQEWFMKYSEKNEGIKKTIILISGIRQVFEH
jgi:hypothetical protein